MLLIYNTITHENGLVIFRSTSDGETRPLLTAGTSDDPLMSPMRPNPALKFGPGCHPNDNRETILDIPLLMAIADGNGNGVGNEFR